METNLNITNRIGKCFKFLPVGLRGLNVCVCVPCLFFFFW